VAGATAERLLKNTASTGRLNHSRWSVVCETSLPLPDSALRKRWEVSSILGDQA
jgi:hypothetical protein